MTWSMRQRLTTLRLRRVEVWRSAAGLLGAAVLSLASVACKGMDKGALTAPDHECTAGETAPSFVVTLMSPVFQVTP